MDGICHESPRWVSLLVAETYYPDTFFPTTTSTPVPPPPPVEDFYNFQQYLKRRVGQDEDDPNYRARPVYKEKKTKPQQHCDGVDHIGCYIVRLYYDWFLVNGSCKCWKPSPKRILTGKWLLNLAKNVIIANIEPGLICWLDEQVFFHLWLWQNSLMRVHLTIQGGPKALDTVWNF